MVAVRSVAGSGGGFGAAAAGSEGFVPVAAVFGVPPADGPLSDGDDGVDGIGDGVPDAEGDGVRSPVPGPTPEPVVGGGGSGLGPVAVQGEYGPAPEGFGGLVPCGSGYVCGKASILPAPTGLACSVTSSSIVFSWNAVAGANDYTAKLQLAVAGSAQTSKITSSTSATFAGLASSTRYYLGVHSNVGDVAQYYSGIYCTTAVGPPVCGAVSATSVRLDWRADFRVHRWFAGRAAAPGSYVDGRSIPGSTLSTTFTGLAEGASHTFYFWWQGSHGGTWHQVYPSTVCTTVAPPSVPLVSCTSTASSITVSWGSVTGATSYRVSKGAGWAVVSGRSHVFSDLEESTTYAVRVQGGVAEQVL